MHVEGHWINEKKKGFLTTQELNIILHGSIKKKFKLSPFLLTYLYCLYMYIPVHQFAHVLLLLRYI